MTDEKKKKLPRWRDRKMCMILYPEKNEAHKEALDLIRRDYHYCAIAHTEDVNEDGEALGPHIHVMMKFGNAQWNTSIAQTLGIELNLIRKLGSLDAYGIYMLHADEKSQNEGKHLYDIKDMEGDLVDLVVKAMEKGEDEGERIIRLVELVESIDSCVTYTQLMKLAAMKGLYADFRRAGYSMKMIWEEHNNEIRTKVYEHRNDAGSAG